MKATKTNIRGRSACFLAAIVLLAGPGLRAAVADPAETSLFVTFTNDASATADKGSELVVQDLPPNGWPYSAVAPVSGTMWNKIARPVAATIAGSGPYTDANPFVLDTVDNIRMYDQNGVLTDIRLKGAVMGSPTGVDPRLLGTSGNVYGTQLFKGTWGTNSNGSVAWLQFTLTGLAPNTDYYLYAYGHATDPNQGSRWMLHPDNYPATMTHPATFYYPTLPARETTYLDLAGHNGIITLYTTGSNGRGVPYFGAVPNTPASSGDGTVWGAMHVRSTADGVVTFRGGDTAFAGRRWMTGFQLIPYPLPTIITHPGNHDEDTGMNVAVGVLNEIFEIAVVARDMQYLNETAQNPLIIVWQVSADNGATWADMANPGPENAFLVTTTIGQGDVTSILRINSIKHADANLYRAKVTNVAGKVSYSGNCLVQVINEAAPFHFTQQPQSLTVTAGDDVSLAAAVTGTPPFRFVWQRSDTEDFITFDVISAGNYGQAANSTFNFPSIQKDDIGFYRIAATDVRRNEANPLYSNVFSMYVEHAAPVITPPGAQTVAPGNTISLYASAQADGGAPIHTYQWQVSHDGGATWLNITDGGAYSGATTHTLTMANASAAEAGLYRVITDNSLVTAHGPEGGASTGGAISLRVGPPLIAHPVSVAADKAGHLFVTDDTTNTIYRFTLASGTAVVFAGQPGVAGSADGFYGDATFNAPGGIVAGAANTVFLADTLNHTIRCALANGDVRTIAGSPSASGNIDATGRDAAFSAPAGVGFDAAGNLYVADKSAHTIRRITPVNYDVSTLAGSPGGSGAVNAVTTEGVTNSIARFNSPGGLAVSPITSGTTTETATSTTTTFYVADTGNNLIRRVALTWYLDRDPIDNTQNRTRISRTDVSTLAGSGAAGWADGIGTAARFNAPAGVAVDATGSRVYVADRGNNVIRLITITAGTAAVSTLAGLPTISGCQDGPDGDNALLNQPRDVSVDATGNVYVADTGNSAVRMISPEGRVSTLVFTRGPDPVPAIPSGTTGTSGTTVFPPAGSGDRGGDMGGGAPSPWCLGALALLGLGRAAPRVRRHFMKIKNLLVLAIVGILGAGMAAPSIHAADNPAVFLKLTRQNLSAGAAPTVATTSTIAAPGSGWNYSAAAACSGTIWNVINRPADADCQDFTTVVGVHTLNTVNNLALHAPDGTASGVSVTARLDVTKANTARAEPGYGSVAADTLLGPAALMNNDGNWRIYYGENNSIWEFAGLPAGAHYLVYCYGATHTLTQGARFILPADYQPVASGTTWLETSGGDGANVFASTDGVISPRASAPLTVNSNTAPNTNTVWGFFHAKVNAAGKLVVQTSKNTQNNQFLTGFQLIPYPKAVITTDLPAATTATLNNPVTFTIVATGFDADDMLTCQWRKDGVDIPGAEGATYTIPSAQVSDEGDYDIVITNYGGDTISGATTLTVTTSAIAPSITIPPVSQTAVTGGSATFSVSANGTNPLACTWQKSVTGIDGSYADIAGAPNEAALALTNITTADAGYYRVKITNGTLPDAISTPASLVVAPVITTQPSGQITTVGAAASLSAVVDAGAGAPETTTCAWTFNGAPLADGNGVTGAATATLQFASFTAANSGYYALTATNSAGSATTTTVYLGTASSQPVTFAPADQSTGISIDQQLRIVFPSAPKLGRGGKLTIHDASDNSTVATIDIAQFETFSMWSATITNAARRTVQGASYYYMPIAIHGNEAWITLSPGQRLSYGKTYYVNIEAAVLLDSGGATLPAINDAATWRFSTKAAGPATPTATTGPATITVGHDGTGDFATLQAASDWIPQNNTLPRTIVIKPGVYRDNATFAQNRNYVTIAGGGAQRTDTVLYYPYAAFSSANDRGAGTLRLESNDINVFNLTIDNGVYLAQPAATAPAFAGPINTVCTSGARLTFDNVLMKGGQDTLYTDKGIATFHDCEIWGGTDFIYGGALAVFDRCDIVEIRNTGGPIGAPSTELAQPHGLVFLNSNFPRALTSNGYPCDVNTASTTFMRPWRQDGHMALVNCAIDTHITAKGWAEWGGRESTCRAIEHGSTLSAGGPVTAADRQAAGAYWVNTVDPDYLAMPDAVKPDAYQTSPHQELLLPPAGHLNRAAITVDPADYTFEAILGNSYYALNGWLPTAKPKILAQPVARNLDEADPLTLNVSAWSPRHQTYQWYKNSTPIPGATSDTYAVASSTGFDAGNYYVVITTSQGSTTSDTVAVTVNSNTPATVPVIATQPESRTFVTGGTVTFNVAATGGGLACQWYKDGVAIPGATAASLTLTNVNLSDAGSYHVVITNALGDVTSSTITLTYDTTAPKPAVFVKLHRDQAAAGAAPAIAETITIAAQGSGWNYTAAAPYAGTTWNKIRRPAGADMISAGIATGLYPGAIGTVATLNTANNLGLHAPDGTLTAVKFTAQVHINALEGDRQEPNAGYISSYTETLMPAAVVNDLWRLIIGNNTFTFTFSDLPPDTRYLVYVYGALNNGNARFDLAPANIANPDARWVGIYAANNNASTHVFARDAANNIAPVPPAPPEDATATIDKPWGVLPALTDPSGQLVITATRFVGSTYVAAFQLIPYPPAAITTQPPPAELAELGASVTLTVAATSFDPGDTITCQWRKDGADIDTTLNPTAATASLTLTNVQSADAGSYDVVITNPGGAVTSTPCALTVNDGSATDAPLITAQPVSLITDAGDPVTLSVDATGGGLSYQWYKNGLALTGATGPALTLANPQASDTGSYHVVITNTHGEITSATVTLTVEGAAEPEAVFVKISGAQSTSAGVTLANAETFAIAAQGGGWDFSAAAPYAGTTWNRILRPHNNDLIVSNTTGLDGTYRIKTADAIALATPSGAPSGMTLSLDIVIADRENNTTRMEPNSSTGASTDLAPKSLMETGWRIYRGGNSTIITLDGLSASKHYIGYFYGATNTANQGARFTLATANVAVPAASWLDTIGAANSEIFETDGTTINPKPPSTPNVNAPSGADTPWGSLHAIADAAGKIVFTTSRAANSGQYFTGFQFIPYPKAIIDIDAPATLSVPAGGTATISVTALGFDAADNLTCQWRKDGVPINTSANPTANTPALTITAADTADEGHYDLVITNYGGSIISGVCALSVTAGSGPPAIYTQPVPQTALTGATVNFSAAVGGAAPLTCAWQKSATGNDAGFVDIPGAASSALVLAGITTADAGYYRIKITNAEGSATSDTVTLIVAPLITTQPAGAIVAAGSPATLTVAADTGLAAAPFAPTYQWQLDGADIPGATSATYSIASFSAADEGSYTVIITNAAGSVTSAPAMLGNPVPPVFTTQPPATLTLVAGLPLQLVSSASGVPAPSCQWHFNGAPIAGATNATLSIASAALADSGAYTVVATNIAGSATSTPSTVTVRDPAGPAILADGFGSAATGGAGGPVYVVTTAAELRDRVAQAGPAIITISGTINLNAFSTRRVDVASNKTIQGADAGALIHGALNIANANNIIVRGLTLTNPGSVIDTDPSSPTYGKYKDSGDGISVWGSTNVFITHCTFYDCGDGCLDITRETANNITVSWCKFYYGADAAVHRFTMILGNIEPDNPLYQGPVHTTLHHNWWSTGCDQRMPASTSARGHMYGNYFTCSGNSYASNARNNSQLLIEHSYYGSGVKDPVQKSAGSTALIRTIDNIYNNTLGAYAPGTDTVFTPPYSYQMDDASTLPALIPQYNGNTDGAFSLTPPLAPPLAALATNTAPFYGDTVTIVPSLANQGSSYQWRLNNFPIPGATSETLVVTGIDASKLGDYTCVVTTAPGKYTVTSPATLARGNAPVFETATGGAISVVTGKSVTITPAVSGAGLAYQWQRNINGAWTNLADDSTHTGATTRSLTIQNATTAQEGSYRLIVTNPTGSVTTDPYALTVTPVLFPHPTGIAVDTYGDLYIADSVLNIIRKVTPSGAATLYAGKPNTAGHYDGLLGLNIFNAPSALAIDAFGNLYVADTGNAVIRRVSRDGAVETLAGDPTRRGSRDAIGTAALLASPNGLAFDRTNGHTYFADTNNHTIRRIVPINLQSTLFVGNTLATISGVPGSVGSDDIIMLSGTATPQGASAKYDHPGAVAYTTGSFAYIADTGNNTIRRITIASGTWFGTVTTLAGLPGVTGAADGAADLALFNHPAAITVDYANTAIYIADTGNHTIRRLTPSGQVTTIAGHPGRPGHADGPGATAQFNAPAALAIDISGSNLYIADTGNAAIRKLTLNGSEVTVTTISIATATDHVPDLTPPANIPTVDPQSGGGGGAPSPWFLAALAALALLRLARRSKTATT